MTEQAATPNSPAEPNNPPDQTTNSAEPAVQPPPPNPDAVPDGEPPAPEPEPTALTFESLTAPEGLELRADDPVVSEFLDVMNNADLDSTARANALLPLFTKQAEAMIETVVQEHLQAWETTQEDWRQQVAALPEIGGPNLDASMAKIAKVLDKYGDAEAREALAVTGAGNHPALVKLFYKIATDLTEAPPVQGQAPGSSGKDRASRMFGT